MDRWDAIVKSWTFLSVGSRMWGMNILKEFRKKTEFQLVMFLAYTGSLIYTWLTTGRHFLPLLYVHFVFVLLFSIIYFSGQFLFFMVAPLYAIAQPIQSYWSKLYLCKFPQSVPNEVVVILGRSNWFMLEAWLKHNFLRSELKALVKLLQAQGKKFSFYPDADTATVEKLMRDPDIKEVYFFGHGNSHVFQLSNDEILYYCDFNNPQYGKEFVHQIHCGTTHGKSLIDYVVPEENRASCFFFRKSINGFDIQKELKRRRKLATNPR